MTLEVTEAKDKQLKAALDYLRQQIAAKGKESKPEPAKKGGGPN
jgi:hypothetical protein